MPRLLLLLSGCLFALSSTAQSWRLVWSDEFNYTGLPDSTKWSYEVGFVRNHEPQYYTDKRLENARVEDGHLVIETRQESYPNLQYTPGSSQPPQASYTSASLNTYAKASWRYGRVEVRAKVPPGKGVWPAIWMMGENVKQVFSPFCGEADILEYYGTTPDLIHETVHWADRHGKWTYEQANPSVGLPADGYHVYAMNWYPTRIEFYYDSVLCFVFKTKKALNKTTDQGNPYPGNPFQKKFYLLLNMALDGAYDWSQPEQIGSVPDSTRTDSTGQPARPLPSPLPYKFFIDYVRVYQDSLSYNVQRYVK